MGGTPDVKELEGAGLHLQHLARGLAAAAGGVVDGLAQQAEVRLVARKREQDEVRVEAVEAVLDVGLAVLGLQLLQHSHST